MELRFSSRSDPEPWRCRRTDGKKWRCSRNVTHGQKYCERHAHKSRSRSRKPVEIQSKIAPDDHSYNNLPISTTITQPIPHFPSSSSIGSVASCDPTRLVGRVIYIYIFSCLLICSYPQCVFLFVCLFVSW